MLVLFFTQSTKDEDLEGSNEDEQADSDNRNVGFNLDDDDERVAEDRKKLNR